MTSELLATRYSVRCYRDFDELAALAQDWNQLVDNAAYPNVFLRWEWVSTWWKWFGDGRPLQVYLVYDDAQLVGILPLYVRRSLGWPRQRHLVLAPIGFGGPTCPEYLGLIVHREAVEPVVERLVTELRSGTIPWSSLELPDVAPDDPGTTALVQRWPDKDRVISHPGERCPICSLPNSYDAFLQRFSSHGRQRERRQVRKALKECNAELRSISCPKETIKFFPTLVQLSIASRVRMGQASPYEDSRYAGFHQDVIAALSAADLLRIFVLQLHGRPAAFLYGFQFDGKYSAFQTGFDPAQARYSPGDVLYQMVFSRLIADDVREFDHLRGDESYKYKFADGQRHTTSFYLFRSRGSSYFAHRFRIDVVRPLRRVAKRVLVSIEGRFRNEKRPRPSLSPLPWVGEGRVRGSQNVQHLFLRTSQTETT